MKTKCLIVDDEPLARDLMRHHLQKLENLEIVAECHNAVKALEKLQEHKIDLMFMDIQMPQISGIDFLKTLTNPPKVIVTSAYPEYAINGFELDILDFLLKPVTFERFLKAINKFYQLRQPEAPNLPIPATPEEFVYVKENRKMLKIYLNEILYIEGLSEYVKIYTENRKMVTKASLTNLEGTLPAQEFLRIHKSYIVSLSKIEAFTSSAIDICGKELPIGRSYKSNVLEILNDPKTATTG
ncbi:MAG TPA: LytTR family DNA-binding domain-containing protein [Prolixibacteraceae bacterium]|nr:LytTR family DNA-binding domain-containing protein [Prolixibacteraceae bacterium]